MPSAPPPPSQEARDRFIELVENGMPPDFAAREVEGPKDGTETALRFKHLANRDPEFGERYARARADGKEAIAEKAYGLYVQKVAFDPDKPNVRALYNLLVLMKPEFKPYLDARIRHVHEGAVGIYALPQIDTAKWTLQEHEEFISLEARRKELLEIARPEEHGRSYTPHALPAGNGSAEVIDVEHTEV